MKRGAKAAKNGKTADDDLAALFERINTRPARDAAAPDKAEVLRGLRDGSLLAGGVHNLRRLAEAVQSGLLDGDDVTDAMRRRLVEHVGDRLQHAKDPAERAAAAAALEAVLGRPGARVQAGEAGPLTAETNGAAPAEEPRRADRAENGRFRRGNQAGKGNPSNRRSFALRQALFRDLDEGKMEALGRRLYDAAMSGCIESTKLLLGYCIGKPRQAVDGDRLDLDEWRLLREAPSLAQVWFAVDQLADPAFAAALWRHYSVAGWPELFKQIRNEMEVSDESAEKFARNVIGENQAKVGK